MKTLFDLCKPRPDVLRGNVNTGAVAEASSDFDALEQLRRFAYAEQGPKPVQLAMWEEA